MLKQAVPITPFVSITRGEGQSRQSAEDKTHKRPFTPSFDLLCYSFYLDHYISEFSSGKKKKRRLERRRWSRKVFFVCKDFNLEKADSFKQIGRFVFFSYLHGNEIKSIDSLNWQQLIGLGVQVLLSSSQFQSASSSSISTWLTSARTILHPIWISSLLSFLQYRQSFSLIQSDVQSSGHINTLAYNKGQMGRQRNAAFLSLFFLHFLDSYNVHQHSAHLSCSSLPVVSLVRLPQMINDMRLPAKAKRSREKMYSSLKSLAKTNTKIERLYEYKQTIGRLSFMLG